MIKKLAKKIRKDAVVSIRYGYKGTDFSTAK